ncbi:class I SAM-dependent methyltransferase [Paenalcaligenes niemegkensis]|uniref:class I SAM-dependent DNA methyltransferase n=1 Tax=Paenalcaligenes niemegkensis TaxID=2895469 RepID=UPI001EE9085F|nr:class I SAM-dependent methyltransferase [Paenalcaligenes niemegkensis]MCQ9615761.1 class I SAM-dependent methyltransferase [Paenalcaligenes niemegkensis]
MNTASSQRTIQHYAQNAEQFKQGTWDHDVEQNRRALLQALSGSAPYDLLDLGCGPGRDVLAFSQLGHRAVGLDGCAQFIAMGNSVSDAEFWHQDMLNLSIGLNRFDGVYANASLFHVPKEQLPEVLRRIFDALRENGVLFSSNPWGEDQEGWNGDRYVSLHSWESWQQYLSQAGFVLVDHYYRPSGLPRSQQPWLASVWRKPKPD